jgi:predicted Zn-dependent protease
LLLGVGLTGVAALRRRSRRTKRTTDLLLVVVAIASLAACSRNTFSYFFSSGETYFAAGKYSAAAIQFENAARLDRNALAAQLNLGKTYVALNRPDKAIAAYQRAVALDPLAVDARIGLAELYLETNRAADSQTELRALLDGSLGDAAATDMYRYLVDATQCTEPASSLLAVADYYIWSGKTDDAVRVLRSVATGATWAPATARIAAIFYDRGDHVGAARLISAILAKEPSSVEGLLLQARMSLNDGQVPAAREFARKAANLAPDAPAVRTALAAMK